MDKKIYVNQLGYRPKDEKKAVCVSKEAMHYLVCSESESGTIVLEADSTAGVWNSFTGEWEVVLDFSSVDKPGKYYIKTEDSQPVSFVIGETVYENVTESLLRFFYLQRCGMQLTTEFAGLYAHPVCHHTPARVYGTKDYLDVSGGWHDAGDFGRYIVAAAVTIAALFHAIENDSNLLERNLRIPESEEKMPDILAEIRYELEWMLKMQDVATGKVYHKVTCANFCDFIMPEEEKEELIVCPFSLTATADFAACMAMAVKFYEPYDEAFAKRMAEAAKRAYDVMCEIQVLGGFLNPEGIVTGTYEDKVETDEQYWAAAELYKAFGEEVYRKDFEDYVNQSILHGYGWEDVASFGNIAYLTCKYPVDDAVKEKLCKSMIAKADDLLQKCNANSYRLALDENGFIWGSNYYIAQNGSHLFDAYKLTGDEKYLTAAKEQIHYILGKNPCDVCFVTGYGEHQVYEPHHRPSAAKKKAMSGMVIGGADSGLHDPDAIRDCTGNAPALCYTDKLLSYSTNEVTIYWNAAVVMLLAQVFEV